MSQEIKKRIDDLVSSINYHRKIYHEEDREEITEQALDSLKDELKKLEEKYPKYIHPNSPSKRVAGKVSDGFLKVEHKVPQWSFDDAFTFSDLENFDKKVKNFLKDESPISYFCELKIDGLKVVLEYKKGLLVKAATRGDGKFGEDVTENVKTIHSLPLKLDKKIDGIFEGEIFISKKNFEKINTERKKSGESLFANPRNLAAGTIRQLDPKIVEKRNLDIFVYDIARIEEKFKTKTQEEEIKFLEGSGFLVNKNRFLGKSLKDIWNFYLEQNKEKETLPYGIDGIVLKVNEGYLQEKLGYTGKAPRFAIALKFPAKQKTTIVEDISLQLGRSGVLTPVAHLKPVNVDGSLVSKATLHNADEIERLDVRVGDTVIVEKSGDIIPKIISVLKELRPKKTKKYTPLKSNLCGGDGEVIKAEGEVYFTCKTFSKKEILKREMVYFIGKKCLDVEDLGDANVESFVDLGLIKEPASLFKLDYKKIKDLEGWGEKSVGNLKVAIEEKRHVPLNRFINSLSVKEVGEETSILLAERFLNLENIIAASKEDLEEIEGIGPKVAINVFDFFKNKEKISIVNNLLQEIKVENFIPKKIKDNFFKNKKFVVTGTFEDFKRQDLEKTIKEMGGKLLSSVSSNLDFLIVGEKAGSKLQKAKSLNIKTLNEKEIKKKIK